MEAINGRAHVPGTLPGAWHVATMAVLTCQAPSQVPGTWRQWPCSRARHPPRCLARRDNGRAHVPGTLPSAWHVATMAVLTCQAPSQVPGTSRQWPCSRARHPPRCLARGDNGRAHVPDTLPGAWHVATMAVLTCQAPSQVPGTSRQWPCSRARHPPRCLARRDNGRAHVPGILQSAWHGEVFITCDLGRQDAGCWSATPALFGPGFAGRARWFSCARSKAHPAPRCPMPTSSRRSTAR